MYSVVQFADTCNEKNCVYVVSRKWLTVTRNGLFCSWPPYADNFQVAKAAMKHADPLPSWKMYAVEKVHYETGLLLLHSFYKYNFIRTRGSNLLKI